MPGELRVVLEAIDRPDLGEQLRRRQRTAAGSSSSAGAVCAVGCSSSRSTFDDRAAERAATYDEFAGDAHLHLRRPAGEPAADPIKVRGSVERLRRDGEGRVELMQLPAQPLLRPAPLVDEIVTVVDAASSISTRSADVTRVLSVDTITSSKVTAPAYSAQVGRLGQYSRMFPEERTTLGRCKTS